MSESRNVDVLKHMIRYCGEIDEIVKRSGNIKDTLLSDSIYRNAAAMCILQIGELTTHLTDEFKDEYSDIPWQDIKGMRNVAAHHYGSIDLEMLYATITEDIPQLKSYCAGIIRRIEVNQQPSIEPEITI